MAIWPGVTSDAFQVCYKLIRFQNKKNFWNRASRFWDNCHNMTFPVLTYILFSQSKLENTEVFGALEKNRFLPVFGIPFFHFLSCSHESNAKSKFSSNSHNWVDSRVKWRTVIQQFHFKFSRSHFSSSLFSSPLLWICFFFQTNQDNRD